MRVAYMSLDEWKSLGATRQAIEDGGDDGEEHSPQSRVTGAAFAVPAEDEMATEPDVQQLIRELAETRGWLQQHAQGRLRQRRSAAPATPGSGQPLRTR